MNRSTLGAMRLAVTLGVLLGLARMASAAPASPIRVAVECEQEGRTKACPAFLLGFIDANKVLMSAPRGSADVVLYVSATEVALADRVHLRFVGTVAGAPSVIEVDVELDSRADDDTQRGQLEPAFLRGIALYVAVRYPSAVTVAFAAPDEASVLKPATTPWDVAINLGGAANWTDKYQNFNGYTSLVGSRLQRTSRIAAVVFANGGLNKSPPERVRALPG